jgi:hypothetical protein
MVYLRTGYFAFLFLFAHSLYAQLLTKEQVGELKIEEVILKPQITTVEGGEGGAGLEAASVGFLWKMHDHLQAKVKIGSLTLLNRPQIFAQDDSLDNSIGFYEAFGQFESLYGDVRFGIIPVGFGWNGTLSEGDIIMPRPQFFVRRWVGLRDFGASYDISYSGFFNRLTIHNGEGVDENPDNQMWMTNNFGWQNGQSFFVGFSGQTGQSNRESTEDAEVVDFTGFDNEKWGKWRIGSLYSVIKNKGFSTTLELVAGERVQTDPDNDKKEVTEQYFSTYWDVMAELNETHAIWMRYDLLDPVKSDEEDQVTEVSLGWSIQNQFKTSTVLMLFTKRLEEPKDLPDDRFSISWKIRPYF